MCFSSGDVSKCLNGLMYSYPESYLLQRKKTHAKRQNTNRWNSLLLSSLLVYCSSQNSQFAKKFDFNYTWTELKASVSVKWNNVKVSSTCILSNAQQGQLNWLQKSQIVLSPTSSTLLSKYDHFWFPKPRWQSPKCVRNGWCPSSFALDLGAHK